MKKNAISPLLFASLLTACQPLVQIPDPTASTPPPPKACPPQELVLPACPVCKTCPAEKSTPTTVSAPASQQEPLAVVGELENVLVDPPGITLKARIDTGAKSSSIHAENIVVFERESSRWVSFDLEDADGNISSLKLPVERRVRIVQANDEIQRRFVVSMRLTLGNISEKVDVTLADRGELQYPLLIGRNFLVDTAVVDVSKKFTQK